jgi:acetyl-CoA acetyltransferase
MTQRYMMETGLTERQLGHVSVAQRAWASTNENAIMRKPITIDDYLAARYVVAPLRLFDYAMINDGGAALILMSAERAKSVAGDRAVVISAVARSDLMVDTTSLRPRLMDFYHTGHRAAAERVYGVAGVGPGDIDAVQVYDGFASRVPFALTGFGFTSDDEIGHFLEAGNLGPGGTLPVNTSGGHLSDSYLHGWTHQVESVRQLRHEAGPNQVEGARRVQYISDVGGKVTSMIYERVGS